MYRRMTQALVITALVASLSGCGGSVQEITVNPVGAVIIDVRTPEEFASGHLDGALNIDVSSLDFDQKIIELDPKVRYLIYCRSGNRSAQALARMNGLGFTDMVDLGSIESASDATGIKVIR